MLYFLESEIPLGGIVHLPSFADIATPADCVMHNILMLVGDSKNVPLKDVMTGVHKAATGRWKSEKNR